MARTSPVDAVRTELALVAARFVLPGLGADVDQAIGVACDLLEVGLDTPATVAVAGLSYGTSLRDAGPVIREMLDEQGFPPDQSPEPLWARGDVATLREAMGEEAFADWQRMVLPEHPRPLTDMERAVLRQAAAPLLADLAASGMSLPDIREEAHEYREDAVCGWIQGPGRTGEGIWVLLDSSPAERVTQLAEQLQNWAADQLHDAGRPPSWPASPQHPNPPHGLGPQVRDGRAVWVCWACNQVIWPIGELDLPGSGARRRMKQGRRP